MIKRYTGRCSCGEIKLAFEGDPIKVAAIGKPNVGTAWAPDGHRGNSPEGECRVTTCVVIDR